MLPNPSALVRTLVPIPGRVAESPSELSEHADSWGPLQSCQVRTTWGGETEGKKDSLFKGMDFLEKSEVVSLIMRAILPFFLKTKFNMNQI